MSTSQRVQILTDKSAELNLLTEFLRNPNLIAELSAEVKKLNSLTEAEESKVAEVREMFLNHPSLVRDIEQKTANLNDAIDAHNAQVKNATEQLKKDRDAHNETVAVVLADIEKKQAEQVAESLRLERYAHSLKDKASRIMGLAADGT